MYPNEEHEPIIRRCWICGYEDTIDDMIDCPKYSEDIGKGIIPGWIDKECCEKEFIDETISCIEHCDNEMRSYNIKNNFEKCFDLNGFVLKTIRNALVYMDESSIFGITAEMDKLLDTFKPLNIVTNKFLDKENNFMYVKDNNNNINIYPLDFYEDAVELFSSFKYYYHPELFCIKDGPLFIIYRIDDNVIIGAIIAPLKSTYVTKELSDIEIVKQYKEKYLDAEKFFGIILQPHEEELKEIIQKLSEDELIKIVLCPILRKLGFKGVEPISFHGPGESGGDFYPFYKENEFGKILFYSAQAKAVKIRSKAGAKEGNVNVLIDQMKKLFRTPFKSTIDNSEKRISHAFIFGSNGITPEAREQLFFELKNLPAISFIGIDEIVNAIVTQKCSDEILDYYRRKYKK